MTQNILSSYICFSQNFTYGIVCLDTTSGHVEQSQCTFTDEQ